MNINFNNITFETGYISNIRYRSTPQKNKDSISIDGEKRHVLYKTQDSKIVFNKTITFAVVNINTNDETALNAIQGSNNADFIVTKNDNCGNYKDMCLQYTYNCTCSIRYGNIIENLQEVPTAFVTLKVNTQEAIRQNVVTDYIGYYTFEDGSLSDVTTNCSDMTNFSATTTTGVKGEANGAYTFDRTPKYFNNTDNKTWVGVDTVENDMEDTTLTAWIKLNDSLKSVIYGVENVVDDGNPIVYFESGKLRNTNNSVNLDCNTGEWVFIAVRHRGATYSSSSVQVTGYQTLTVNETHSSESSVISTGVGGGGVANMYLGRGGVVFTPETGNFDIDNVRIYHRLLTDSELLQIRNFEKP